MVDTAGVAQTVSNVGSGAISGLFIVLAIVVGCMIIGGATWWYNHNKKYSQYKIEFYFQDGYKQWHRDYDRAGVFVDAPTGYKRLFLDKMKVNLQADKIPFIPDAKGNRIVSIARYGQKNYRFLTPNIETPDTPFTVGEEDVNWAVVAYEKAKKRFVDSMLMQILPYAALFFTGVVILIIFLYFFKKIDVLQTVAISFEKAANAFATHTATTIA